MSHVKIFPVLHIEQYRDINICTNDTKDNYVFLINVYLCAVLLNLIEDIIWLQMKTIKARIFYNSMNEN